MKNRCPICNTPTHLPPSYLDPEYGPYYPTQAPRYYRMWTCVHEFLPMCILWFFLTNCFIVFTTTLLFIAMRMVYTSP